MTAMLNVKDLRAYLRSVQALHGLEFALNEGRPDHAARANGAGKTTTLRAICNMVRSTGAIEFDGAPLTGRSTENIVRLGIAHVPQGRGTFTTMTVEENLQLGAITRNDKAGVISISSACTITFPSSRSGIRNKPARFPAASNRCSRLARALMLRPRLMLLDEPSFGLAPLIVRDLFKILGKINREDKVTILVVEQNAQLALELADKAYVIEDRTDRDVGGSAAEIANNEDVRKSYLGLLRSAGHGAFYQSSPGWHRHRRDLCLHGARRRHDLPGDRSSQFRPGRDGDVLDLCLLAADAMGRALLGGVPDHVGIFVCRRQSRSSGCCSSLWRRRRS